MLRYAKVSIERRLNMRRTRNLWFVLPLAAAFILGLWAARSRPAGETPPAFELPRPAAKAEAPAAQEEGLSPEERSTIRLFQRSMNSVVYITTLVVRRGFFNLNATEVPAGTGSGFLWDDKGHIVTNYHVIRGADAARITLADGSTHEARLIGAAPDKDIAVLKIDVKGKKLSALSIGRSHDLKVGQRVYAIGNPFGLDHTLTTGIISALGREIQSITRRPIQDVIQTDAAINPGNSGGPLLDSSGRLIGVNTLIYSPSGAFAGIGFAVPVDIVKRIVPELIKHGKVMRPGLGILPARDDVTRQIGVNGVLILNVTSGSVADRAQLRPTRRDSQGNLHLGDVITAIDDRPVRELNDLFKALDNYQVGDEVEVACLRDGRERKVRLNLQSLD
ncbi:MAG: trypsin-like peptidase domain-containing protein [Elusimicrobiota bacterium]